jgi:hypothetical protein
MAAAPAEQRIMDHRIESDSPTLEFKTAIADGQALAREQLGAVWQLHVERVREQLEAGWHEQIEHILQERFSEIATRLQSDFDRAVGTRSRELAEKASLMARTAAQRELTGQLNQTARRLEQAENREVWIRTLLEATDGFCSRAALFALNGKSLRYEGGKGIGDDGNVLEAEIPIASAPAFQNAADSMDTVIALGTRSELSDAAADFLGNTSSKKIYLFPLLVRQKAVGILYAEPGDEADIEPVDVSALELLSLLAAKSIEATERVTVQAKSEVNSGLIRISGIEEPRAQIQPAAPPQDEQAHISARRFARTNTAQILLYKAQQVRSGRASGDLYSALKEDIDAGRNAFRQQFLTRCSSMVDHYHQELVERLANHDSSLLGPRYPGPLA